VFEETRQLWCQKISASINYSSFLSQRRFEELCPIFIFAFADLEKRNNKLATYYPYYPIIELIDDFNKIVRQQLQLPETIHEAENIETMPLL
jgi:hypothetical protein